MGAQKGDSIGKALDSMVDEESTLQVPWLIVRRLSWAHHTNSPKPQEPIRCCNMGDNIPGLIDMEQQIKGIKEQIKTARGYQRLLKARLASLNATSTADDIRANITTLELKKEELSSRLQDIRTGQIKAVRAEERELADQALQDWAKKADSRKQIFLELWAIARDMMPEGQTKEKLWVSIILLQYSLVFTDSPN